MAKAKKIMLTNKSARVFSTSIGNFHPGTSKEFDEKEAFGLLGYTTEIFRVEDAIGNPEFRDTVKKLRATIADLEAELKKEKENKVKEIDHKVYDDIKEKNVKIITLGNRIKELEDTCKGMGERDKVQDVLITELKAEKKELEKKLKAATKK